MQTNDEIFPVLVKSSKKFEPKLSIEYDVPSKSHGYFDFVVYLEVSGKFGRCCLKKIDTGLLETHSSLAPELCGKGYGTMLYSAAIRFAKEMGFRVCSSKHRELTIAARRVWKGQELNKSFKIVRGWERFYVI